MPQRLTPEETYHAYGVIPCALTGGYLGDRGANIKDIRFGSGAMVRLRPFRIRLGTLGKLRGVKIWGTIPQVKEALIRSAKTMKSIHERQGEEQVELTWVFLCPRRLKVSQSEVMQRCRVDLMIEPSRGWDLIHVRGKTEEGFANAMEFIIKYTELGKFDLTMELQVLGQNICFPIDGKKGFRKRESRNLGAEDEYRAYSGMDEWRPAEYRTFNAEPSRRNNMAPQQPYPPQHQSYNFHEVRPHQQYGYNAHETQSFPPPQQYAGYGNQHFSQPQYSQPQSQLVQPRVMRAAEDELPAPPPDYQCQQQQAPVDSRLHEIVPQRAAKRRPKPEPEKPKGVTVSDIASLIAFCNDNPEIIATEDEKKEVVVEDGKCKYPSLLDGFPGGSGEIIPEEKKKIRGRKRKYAKRFKPWA